MKLQREYSEEETNRLAEFERCSLRMNEIIWELRDLMSREYAFYHIRVPTMHLNDLPVMDQEAWDKTLES